MIDTLSKKLRIPRSAALESVIKAKLIGEVMEACSTSGMTHAVLASRSGLPRSAVTGILSGSLQKVTLDRILRLVEAAGLSVEIKVKRAS